MRPSSTHLPCSLSCCALVLLAGVLAACAPGEPEPPPSAPCEGDACEEEPPPPPPCVVEPIDEERDVDPFYEKECVVLGIPVLGSGVVRDEALVAAAELVAGMLEHREDLAEHIVRFGGRISIVAETENTTDVPEFAYLADDPDTDWNQRARGFGATLEQPVMLGAEEDVLCLASNRWAGQSIFVHEFAHTVHLLAIPAYDDFFDIEVTNLWHAAIDAGRWENTYAGSHWTELWAECVQSFFEVNAEADPPDGVKNHVNTRAELLEYEPDLHAVITRVFKESASVSACP